MSIVSRFAGAVRHTLSVRALRPDQLVVRGLGSQVGSGAWSISPVERRYMSPAMYTPPTHSTMSTISSYSPPTGQEPRRPATTAVTTTEDTKSSEVVTATASTPGALATGYYDNYYNHPHRHMPGDSSKRAFTYLILGSTKFIAASAVRVAILKLIYTMSASADVLALGSVEVDLAAIPLGESATIKWRGKPVFIRHRTDSEIQLAAKDDDADLRHAESDADRVEKPEWLVVLGVCTHLGCVPIANAGDYQGWFCPCHGSHYDVSGRIRKGPAPLNLEVPTYRFVEDDTKMILG